jgi:hypothetical protein
MVFNRTAEREPWAGHPTSQKSEGKAALICSHFDHRIATCTRRLLCFFRLPVLRFRTHLNQGRIRNRCAAIAWEGPHIAGECRRPRRACPLPALAQECPRTRAPHRAGCPPKQRGLASDAHAILRDRFSRRTKNQKQSPYVNRSPKWIEPNLAPIVAHGPQASSDREERGQGGGARQLCEAGRRPDLASARGADLVTSHSSGGRTAAGISITWPTDRSTEWGCPY